MNTPIEARNALMDYLYDREEALPDDIRRALRDLLYESSPVKLVVEAIRLLVDRWPDVPKELRAWGLEAAVMASTYGFSDITADVVEVMR